MASTPMKSGWVLAYTNTSAKESKCGAGSRQGTGCGMVRAACIALTMQKIDGNNPRYATQGREVAGSALLAVVAIGCLTNTERCVGNHDASTKNRDS